MATFGPLRIMLTGLLLMHAGTAGAQGPSTAAATPGMPMPLTPSAPVHPITTPSASVTSGAQPSVAQPSAPERPAVAGMPRPTTITTGSRVHPVIYRVGTMDRPGLTARVAGPDETGPPSARRNAGAPP